MSAAGRIAKLGDIAVTIDYGHTASATREPVGPKFLRITDIQDDRVEWDLVPYCICEEKEKESSKLATGDIVFARTGATTGKSYLIRDCPNNSVFASYLIRVRLESGTLPSYVAHFFKTPEYWRQISRSSTGTAQAGVNASSLRLLEVPLPPLAEQRRIAVILDHAEALRAKRRKAIAKLDALAPAVFQELFGDPVANDRNWPSGPVAGFVAAFETGKNIMAAEEESKASEYRVLKVSAVTSMTYQPNESKPVPKKYRPPESHIVRSGDLLFSRANTTELVGATAFVFDTPDNLLLPDKIWRFVWHQTPRAEPLFVWYLFRHKSFRYEIGTRSTGTSGSMKNVSQEKVLSVKVGLPPLELQRQFEQYVRRVESTRANQRASLAKLDALFASLQHRAFRGEL